METLDPVAMLRAEKDSIVKARLTDQELKEVWDKTRREIRNKLQDKEGITIGYFPELSRWKAERKGRVNLTRLGGSYHKSLITYEKLMAQDDRVEPSTLFTKTTPQTKARRKNRRALLFFLVAQPCHSLNFLPYQKTQ